jgi:hypothetical protein
MFVLMVAALSPLLSDDPPDLVRRAKLGDRFHYWRGRSGRRYLFSAVDDDALSDFRSAVALIAEPAPDGRLVATAIALLDGAGRVLNGEMPWPRALPPDTVLLVHLLAQTDAERWDVVADLSGRPLRLAA